MPSLAVLATVAGPAFSYALMGSALVAVRGRPRAKWLGLALVSAALPFARLFTALMGRGDEAVVLQAALSSSLTAALIKVLAIGVVSAFCIPHSS
jgi:hypothetical protein